jgi:predicted ester cyclase
MAIAGIDVPTYPRSRNSLLAAASISRRVWAAYSRRRRELYCLRGLTVEVPDELQGVAGVQQTMLWLGSVFSDQRWEIHRVICEGDVVVVYCTLHGRHTGDLMGIPPTNREIAMDYVHILRFSDGKAVERWGVRDDMALMRQLGALPARPAAVAAAS